MPVIADEPTTFATNAVAEPMLDRQDSIRMSEHARSDLQPSGLRLHLTPLDGLLLLVVLIWGSNFSIVKVAIEEIPIFGFNTLRMGAACIVLLIVSRLNGEGAPERGDWPRLMTLGFFGHCCYQLAFVTGLARTTVANSSLILGCMPVSVLVLNALSGRPEAVGKRQWLGIGFAVAGVYLVAGQGAGATTDTLLGDALTMAALWCWAWYTTGSRALLERYSPLRLSAYATLVGTLCYTPFGVPDLLRLDWGGVSAGAWVALVVSGLLALSVAHIIWYTGVKRLGSARTAVYGNLVPVTAMAVAFIWLNEPIGAVRLVGAALVLTGLVLTRVGRSTASAPV